MKRVSLLFGLVAVLGLVVVGCSDDDGEGDQEICNDLVDNDGDGLNNCADPDCVNDPACTAVCGNGTCEPPTETTTTCPQDCTGPVCGNGTCETGENATNCPDDCTATCGNGTCEAGEDATNCPADCGGCDGVCDQVEDLVEQCGCNTGEMCTVLDQAGTIGCYAEGSTAAYEPCTYVDDCVAGTVCVGNPSACLPFCDLEARVCPGDGVCAVSVPTAGGNVGVCVPPDNCDLMDATGCETGEACYPASTAGDTLCITAGTAGVGENCTYNNDCGIAMVCSSQSHTCIELCESELDCTTGTCQQIGYFSTTAPNDDVGICM